MTNKSTSYDLLKEKWVGVIRDSLPYSIGFLLDVDLDRIVLQPHLFSWGDSLVKEVALSDRSYIIPYSSIRGVLGLPEGYVERVLLYDKIVNRFNLQMRIVDLKAKGINDPKLEEALTRVLEEYSL